MGSQRASLRHGAEAQFALRLTAETEQVQAEQRERAIFGHAVHFAVHFNVAANKVAFIVLAKVFVPVDRSGADRGPTRAAPGFGAAPRGIPSPGNLESWNPGRQRSTSSG